MTDGLHPSTILALASSPCIIYDKEEVRNIDTLLLVARLQYQTPQKLVDFLMGFSTSKLLATLLAVLSASLVLLKISARLSPPVWDKAVILLDTSFALQAMANNLEKQSSQSIM
ncbi:hypothetical protein TNCT_248571 [Trichonephila clavata]|uniref:Uncharacterized protein n=1 Tax=Trichonephila clavata TaxID=2740835 RepID=A0A8X6GR14_TRICU|nr:hypothetical protein TNCT_248571 [Trichonephila clavata]